MQLVYLTSLWYTENNVPNRSEAYSTYSTSTESGLRAHSVWLTIINARVARVLCCEDLKATLRN